MDLKKPFFIQIPFSEFRLILVAPFIYMMILPALILDGFVWLYQQVVFRVLDIKAVSRSDYIFLDRHGLSQLTWIEKVNCDYCGYFNGLIAYVREVAARTEQYFCPIRHPHRVKGLHARHQKFLPYQEDPHYSEKLDQKRSELVENHSS